jgi:bifunctional enzyme Fae/Hps
LVEFETMAGRQLLTPCLQVALDSTDEAEALRACDLVPRDPRIAIEAGTPLIKQFGIGIVRRIKQASGNAYVVADLKTMDVGALEIQMAKGAGADAAICSGAAGNHTIDAFIGEAKKEGIFSFLDMVNVPNMKALLRSLKQLPDGVSLHRGHDAEAAGAVHSWDALSAIKNEFPGLKIAVAGGMNLDSARMAAKAGADVVVIGRFITRSQNPTDTAKKALEAILSP